MRKFQVREAVQYQSAGHVKIVAEVFEAETGRVVFQSWSLTAAVREAETRNVPVDTPNKR